MAIPSRYLPLLTRFRAHDEADTHYPNAAFEADEGEPDPVESEEVE